MPTEKDWCVGSDSISMAAFVQARVSDRKLRLIAAASCRILLKVAAFPWVESALRAAEQYADGLICDEDLAEARQRVCEATFWAGEWADETSEENAARAIRALLLPKAGEALREVLDALERHAHLAGTDDDDRLARSRKEMRRQAQILRELVGNPFRPVTVPWEWREWHGFCLVRLAREIYESRAYHDIPILGDMLQDAGCTEEALLEHCKSGCMHEHGCWMLDAILGRT